MRISKVRAWPVWRERRRVLALLAVVELLALVAPVASWTPASRADLVIAVFLASLSVTYSVFVFGWEKARRLLLFERMPSMTPNVQGTWGFAAALLLPPAAAVAVTVVSSLGAWRTYNPAGNRRVYRYVYSTAGTVLATTACSSVFRLGLPLAATLALAAVLWVLIGAGGPTIAMCASGDLGAAREMLHLRTYWMVFATMGVAVVEYGVSYIAVPLMWLSLPAAVAIQRHFVTRELHSREPHSRPMEGHAWLHVAKVIVAASETVSVLRIDTDDQQAARMVAMLQAGCDAIGTTGNRGLAILLPDCPPAQADALARRLRIAMTHHRVACSIAAVSKPRDGQVLEDLLAISEAELVARDASRRSASSS